MKRNFAKYELFKMIKKIRKFYRKKIQKHTAVQNVQYGCKK